MAFLGVPRVTGLLHVLPGLVLLQVYTIYIYTCIYLFDV